MSHIDTLKVYQEYKAAGLNDHQAQEYTNILENSFMTKVIEMKQEFISNRWMNLVATVMIAIASFTLVKVWDLSHDMIEVKSRLTTLEQKLN